jgi:nucleoredoxin
MSSDAAASASSVPVYEQGAKAMKAYLDEYGVDYKDCVEKSELVQRVKDTMENPPAKPEKKQAAAAASSAGGKVGQEIVNLLGDKLLAKSGGKFNTSALQAKVVALYFSAHWCGPCRSFTPALAQLYTDKLKSAGVEVVFISSDQDDSSFAKYYQSMPWLAVPFDARDVKQELSERFEIQGIPSLIVLDAATGKVLSKDGRRDVMSHKADVGNFWLRQIK